MEPVTDRAGGFIKAGLAILGLAAVGYLVTLIAVSFTARPHTVEDLTAAWRTSGPSALGTTVSVTVPPGDTLVTFLVGADLTGIAGTTGGDCSVTAEGRRVPLGWPVQIETVLNGILQPGQQIVAIAGWHNDGSQDSAVDITCTTRDSTVDHFVAVSTHTAVVVHGPWFQPWLWATTAGIGLLVLGSGVGIGIAKRSSR